MPTARDIFLKIDELLQPHKENLLWLQNEVAPKAQEEVYPTTYWFSHVMDMTRKGLVTESGRDLEYIRQSGPKIIAEDIGQRLTHRRDSGIYSSRTLVQFDRSLISLEAFATSLIQQVEPMIAQYQAQQKGSMRG